MSSPLGPTPSTALVPFVWVVELRGQSASQGWRWVRVAYGGHAHLVEEGCGVGLRDRDAGGAENSETPNVFWIPQVAASGTRRCRYAPELEKVQSSV